MTTKEKVQQRLNHWKAQLEDLNVQLHLGKAEAIKAFEKQKEELKERLKDAREAADDLSDLSEKQTQDLKSLMEELEVQLALGRAETLDAVKNQQEKINARLKDLKNELEENYSDAEGRIKEFSKNLDGDLEYYRSWFELTKMRWHLAEMDAKDAWDENRKEIEKRIQELKVQLEEGAEEAEERWDHFSKEINQAWKHIRNAFVK